MSPTVNKRSELVGWVILTFTLVLGYLIFSHYKELNLFFLFLLIADLIAVIIYFRKFSITQITLSRIILGIVFIYSGLVKGIDPVGFEYRIHDYFTAFGTEWANPLSLSLSVILNASEFILGILLLFNVKIKITSSLVVLMMAVFTVLTLNDALYNLVPDCGCFGDAIIITNWQTFYKNLVIDSLLLMVFLARGKIKPWFSNVTEWGIFFVFFIAFISFEIYNIRHLPVIDFRDWKVGNKMVIDNPQPLEYYLSYRNKQTGEVKEYLSPDYPYNDSVWMAEWEFVSQRIVDHNPPLHDLSAEDGAGNNITSDILENPEFQFILISYDITTSNTKKINEIRSFIESCNENGISFVALTSSLQDEVNEFKMSHSLEVDFYYADDISLKTMIRSNPGLILMKDAVILEKWHHNDFPDFFEFSEDYIDE